MISREKRCYNTFINVFVAVALGITLSFIYKPEEKIEISYFEDDLVDLSHYCGNSYDIIIFIMVGYNGVISLVCCIYAFKARNLPRDYNEGRFVSFAMFTFLFLWLMAIPIYCSQNKKVYKSASWCILCLLSTLFIFIPMYLPKVYLIIFWPDRNTVQTEFITCSVT